MKSSLPNLHPKENVFDRQTRELTNILLSILLIMISIGAVVVIALWTLSDITGEYACISPRLGMVRLSLIRNGEILKGDIKYGYEPALDLIASSSVRQEEINLSFATSQEFPKRGRYRRINLLGKFENGSILGVVVDSGTPYPVNLRRNVIYSIVKRFQSIWPIH